MNEFAVSYQKSSVTLFINRSEDEMSRNYLSWSSNSQVGFSEALEQAALLEEMSKLGDTLVAMFEAGELESFIMGHTFRADDYEFIAFNCKRLGVVGLDVGSKKIRFLDYGKIMNEFEAIPSVNRTDDLQKCFDALIAAKKT